MRHIKKYEYREGGYNIGEYVETNNEYCVSDDYQGCWVWDDKFKIINTFYTWIGGVGSGAQGLKKYVLKSWSNFDVTVTVTDIKRELTNDEIEEYELKKSMNDYNL